MNEKLLIIICVRGMCSTECFNILLINSFLIDKLSNPLEPPGEHLHILITLYILRWIAYHTLSLSQVQFKIILHNFQGDFLKKASALTSDFNLIALL